MLNVNKINSTINTQFSGLCILIMIINDLEHEKIWKYWLENNNNNPIKLLMHAKYPSKVTSSWVRNIVYLSIHTVFIIIIICMI